jgi:hypothetical protein
VIIADHGARVYGKSQIPIRTYEIPCLIWSPKHVKPAEIDELSSQIDLAPTVLRLLGLPYHAPFAGRDILADTPNPPIMLFSHNHDVGLYDGEHLIVLGMQRQVWNYRYDRTADRLITSPHDPNLEKLAVPTIRQPPNSSEITTTSEATRVTPTRASSAFTWREIGFGDTAVGAPPIIRHICPESVPGAKPCSGSPNFSS